MSKKIFILLLIGFVFLGSGFALLFHFTISIEEKYPGLIIFLDGELEQAQLLSTPIDLLEKDEITVTLTSSSDSVFFSLSGPDESILYETLFSQSLSFPFVSNSTGTHIINVGNMESHPIKVNGFITEKPVIIDDFVLSVTSGFVAASILLLIGVIVIILSLVILVLKKIFSKNNSKKISK